jgi:uncharacterized protein
MLLLLIVIVSALVVFFCLWLLARAIVTPIFRRRVFRGDLVSQGSVAIPHEQYFLRNAAGESIDLWWIPNPFATEALLYLHGNAGRLPHFFETFCSEYNVLAPAYPGYGLSEGESTEANVYETAVLGYQWLQDKGYREDQITIYGHSLGGAPAVYLASIRPKCKKLIVVNSFKSLKSLCRKKYGWLASLLIKDWFNSGKYAKGIEGRVVQFCYRHDKIIPFEECASLFESFKSTNKDMVPMDGPCHSYYEIEFTVH